MSLANGDVDRDTAVNLTKEREVAGESCKKRYNNYSDSIWQSYKEHKSSERLCLYAERSKSTLLTAKAEDSKKKKCCILLHIYAAVQIALIVPTRTVYLPHLLAVRILFDFQKIVKWNGKESFMANVVGVD